MLGQIRRSKIKGVITISFVYVSVLIQNLKANKLKVLPNNQKTKEYFDSLPKIYIVGLWAKYGVREYPFTEKYFSENGFSIPLVYDYDDHNGTCDNYYLRRIDRVTSGQILLWTQSKSVASKVAELFNKELKDED